MSDNVEGQGKFRSRAQAQSGIFGTSVSVVEEDGDPSLNCSLLEGASTFKAHLRRPELHRVASVYK